MTQEEFNNLKPGDILIIPGIDTEFIFKSSSNNVTGSSFFKLTKTFTFPEKSNIYGYICFEAKENFCISNDNLDFYEVLQLKLITRVISKQTRINLLDID